MKNSAVFLFLLFFSFVMNAENLELHQSKSSGLYHTGDTARLYLKGMIPDSPSSIRLKLQHNGETKQPKELVCTTD